MHKEREREREKKKLVWSSWVVFLQPKQETGQVVESPLWLEAEASGNLPTLPRFLKVHLHSKSNFYSLHQMELSPQCSLKFRKSMA